MGTTDVRPSPLAGTWYSRDPEQLQDQVDTYLSQAQAPVLEGDVVGLVAPHAGYRYSGLTAGHAFRCVQGQAYDLVVVVSPFHDYIPKPILTSAHRAYETPLGTIPVDGDVLTELDAYLLEHDGSVLDRLERDSEHAVEIELPFLQRALMGEFKLLPIMIPGLYADAAFLVGRGLAHVLRGRSALLVASTDLSHYKAESKANELDGEMLKQIASLSPDDVWETQLAGKGYACGIMAVLAVMTAALELGVNNAQVVHYSTSGQTSGDYQRVVGYGAVVFLKQT